MDTHRKADPELSAIGRKQADRLRDFLVPHLINQASKPVRVITSPMRRTLETIRPTLEGLQQQNYSAKVMVHGFYFESEGCHVKDKPQEGMNPAEISQQVLKGQDCDFVGFPDQNRGWYLNGKGAETREESERRAARFYLWLLEQLDQELLDSMQCPQDDVFDAGVAVPGEEGENEHDKHAPRKRKRRTTLLVGHGDFMSLVLKRIVAGFGHAVEHTGVPHRSAFVHFNTGITELEYFGNGRFLIMAHNQTPHIPAAEYAELRSGGSLKDGWSYLMPNDQFMLDAEVQCHFSDELEEHVKEQTEALKALYLSSRDSDLLHAASNLSVDSEEDGSPASSIEGNEKDHTKHFIVRRGMQVVGTATYSEKTGHLTDVAVRPSAGIEASETLFKAVKEYSRRMGRSGSLLVLPRSEECKSLFEKMGFTEMDGEGRSMSMEITD